MTIDILPDDILLLIFLFDRATSIDGLNGINPKLLSWRWDRLVHVCRRWRVVVFASPNSLDLKIVCGPWTHVELTGVWPPLPIVIWSSVYWPLGKDYDFETAIVHYNRVCEVTLLCLSSLQLQRYASAMQEKFPALMHLKLSLASGYTDSAPALPDGFLGGYTPRLQSLELHSIPFPALPKLLLSATDLVRLFISNIPHFGYLSFSPEVIVTVLAALVNLKYFSIEFKYPQSRSGWERRHTRKSTRIVLPALTDFVFYGLSEYLEDVLADIDVPLLESILITFFHQPIFDIPQLAQLMGRTTRFQTPNEAHVYFNNFDLLVGYHVPLTRTIGKMSGLTISSKEMNQQSSLEQVFTSFFPSVFKVEHLYIYEPGNPYLQWHYDYEGMHWPRIFDPFTAVKNLYLSKEFITHIAPVLYKLSEEGGTDVLPALQNIYLGIRPSEDSEPFQEFIAEFVAARQLASRPITVSFWERDPDRTWAQEPEIDCYW